MRSIEERPYSDIGDEAYEKNLKAMSLADVVVLADVDIGRSNLRNVQMLREVENQKLYLLREKAEIIPAAEPTKLLRNLWNRAGPLWQTETAFCKL